VNGPIVDVNINLSRWPCRRLPHDETASLVENLRTHGVVEAWAGSFDGLLHKNLAAVNNRLAHECRTHTGIRLIPFGSVNPLLPDWEEDLRRCVEQHHMPGIRLHPNYHGYKLDHPSFSRLLKLAAEHRLLVALAVIMEDERTMHPLLPVPPVNLDPLPALVTQTPGLRLILLNALSGFSSPSRSPLPPGRKGQGEGNSRGETLVTLVRSGEVYVEIAMLERVAGVANLLNVVPHERVLFGSHAPFFYFESALLKLKESALSAEQLKALQEENARRLLAARQ
jgi:predicted TIM-barrel fold metal-dependent hydrolase